RWAASRTFWTAGMSRPINTAMMAMTTSSSMRVKALRPIRARIAHLQKKRIGEVRCERKGRTTAHGGGGANSATRETKCNLLRRKYNKRFESNPRGGGLQTK